MPSFSSSSPGSHTVNIPANAQNVEFYLVGAKGGASQRWYYQLGNVGWHAVSDPTNWGAWSSFMNQWAVWISPNNPNPTNQWHEAVYSMHVPYPSGNVEFHCQSDNQMQIHIEAPGVQGWTHIISQAGFTSTHVHTRYMVHGTWHVKMRVYNNYQSNNAWHENPAGGAFTIYKDGNMIKNSRDMAGQIGTVTWNKEGGAGRAGYFNIDTRSSAYTLTFYLGGQGGMGVAYRASGEGNRGGGGSSPVAGGGNGFSCGGGGGGASAVYDSYLNRYTVVSGGGGGAGRLDLAEHFAGLGYSGGGRAQAPSFRGGDSATAGNTGGGGGGQNWHNATSMYGQTNPPTIGYGGASYWYGDSGGQTEGTFTGYGGYSWDGPGQLGYGDGVYICSYSEANASIDSFTASTTTITAGQGVQLCWNTTDASAVTLNGSGVNADDCTWKYPGSTTTYTLTAVAGNTVSQAITVTVYIPPNVTLSLSSSSIQSGQSATLTWVTTGDANSASINQGIGSVPVNSFTTVSPTQTTTYTISVSGSGGSDSDSITLTVIAPPSVTLSVADEASYGDDISLTYQATNCTGGLRIDYRYRWGDNTYSAWATSHTLPTGTNLGPTTVIHSPAYSNLGPYDIEYNLIGENGYGASDTDLKEVAINIDTTPDTIVIPPSEGKDPDEEPVISPDVEITTDTLEINDIDIPVEIKASQPAKLEIDDSGIWVDVREI